MMRSELISKLEKIIAAGKNHSTSDQLAEYILAECEREGMLPPGKEIELGGMKLQEHTWDDEE